MNIVIVKDGEVKSVSRGLTVLDPKWLTRMEADGFEIMEIPAELADESAFKLDKDGNVVVDETAKAAFEKEMKKLDIRECLPDAKDLFIAEYFARKGDASKRDAIDAMIDAKIAEHGDVYIME